MISEMRMPGSGRGIRWKLAASFIAVAFFVALFVAVTVAIFIGTVERAAQLEAGHIAELIADAAIERSAVRADLQAYVVNLNSVLGRDVVILDVNRKGLADADAGEIGMPYGHDAGGEVSLTIGDGRSRIFVEKNDRHPAGARQTVVPLRRSGWDANQPALGAVILEYTQIRDQLLSAERGDLYLSSAAGIALVLLVTLFGLHTARRIAQPLEDLHRSVERIAAHDYGVRVAVRSRDEIGRLGTAFNKMAEDLSVSHAELVEHKQQLEKRVAYLAYYDILTGLANRTLFHERLAQSVATARAQNRQFALVLTDIERFKTINDTLGQPAGDSLLKEYAARMSNNMADADRVARLDADHFAVIVPGTQDEAELARRIERRAGEVCDPPFQIGGSTLRILVKYGIAVFPADGADADTLLRNAEAALKNAKESDARYLFYTRAMNERLAERLSLESRLRQALDKGAFLLHYQSKVNLASGKLTGAEALIRWNDPLAGMVPPERFIPILEETGMIHDVGRWALRKAVQDYLRWHAAGLPAMRVSVNVSARQMRDRNFVEEIRQAIGADPNAAAGLELEITESLIMEDVKISIASLQAIRAMGVTIAIDDFGTGYSSLSHLARLPVNTLKIDRSFVNGMTAGPDGLALISAFISLAHSLKLKVVAEGVETEEQSSLLRLLGCDEMQGFLICMPITAQAFEERFLASVAHA